jgi:predicted transcriptional regulator
MSDQDTSSSDHHDYIELAADIVSAFVSNNSVPAAELPTLISTVHAALQNVGRPAATQPVEKAVPAVPVKKSITPDFLISLEDGKRYKSLKRHLAGRGLTPAEYRAKWDLPPDYPMVAPNYAAVRSELAKKTGLGQQRRKAAAKSAGTSETVASKAPKKAGRKKAA